MTDINPPHINRRRMLSITATTVAGLAAGALASSGPAQAAPSLCDLPGTGSVDSCGPLGVSADCGGFNDVTPPGVTDRLFLWDRVKNVTPAYPDTNQSVVVPPNSTLMKPTQPQPVPNVKPPLPPIPGKPLQGYAIREGGTPGGTGPNNRLLVPTQRLKGIECEYIYDRNILNFCKIAFDEANRAQRPQWTFPAIGINSIVGRKQDQLHLHLSRTAEHVMPSMDYAVHNKQVAFKPADWLTVPSTYIDGRAYRILHVPNLDDNPFRLLHRFIVSPVATDMGNQILAIVPALIAGGGYYLINSELALHDGIQKVDDLLYYN